MGLDMYAYAVDSKDVISPIEVSENHDDFINFHSWRKHPNLHGWMQDLYEEKGGEEEFNCEFVELTEDDLFNLANDILRDALPATTGFYFGEDDPILDDETFSDDMLFIRNALKYIREGKRVFYSSWW